ncbi:MAG: hypothetical protein M3R65_09025, partial [Gemmatimonadota bacterium]|nr:hypothetical protein [Gemmatimonadota bacterium]
AGATAATSAPVAQRAPRSRRGRGGRGRARDRTRGENTDAPGIAATGEHVADAASTHSEPPAQSELSFAAHATHAAQSETAVAQPEAPVATSRSSQTPPPTPSREAAAAVAETAADGIGAGGMRLTRDEAFDLMRRAVAHIAKHGGGTRATDVRGVARELLGRDSESLSERNFVRILKDAHDSDIIDLRRRGDDYEVRPAVVAAPIGEQLGAAAIANAPAAAPAGPPAPRGMGSRGGGGRMQRSSAKAAPPMDLLSVGVVDYDGPTTSSAATAPTPTHAPLAVATGSSSAATSGRTSTPAVASRTTKPTRGRKTTAKKTAPVAKAAAPTEDRPAARAGVKSAAKSARKKTAARK